MSRCCRTFLDTITRRKPWDVRSLHQTEMTRSLNTVELVGIGVGSCAGLGVFVLIAHVTKHEAGPAVVLSVLVAGILALLSGLCHMELTTRLPRSGTGYTFCYITLGELLAFVVGWSTVLEYAVIGALAGKAVWQYVEYIVHLTDTRNVTSTDPELPSSEMPILVSRLDLIPCGVMAAIVCLGFISIKRYALLNFISTCLSGVVVLAFICVGLLHVDPDNWNSEPGFFAKGFAGVLAGAALLMCVFAGIDNLASCAEESRDPHQSLPTAFGFSTAIVATVLFLVTAALTLASPWWELADDASLARAYEDKGIYAAHYVVGVGAVFGLLPVAFGCFVHPVRVLYAMAEDRLVPRMFSKRASFNGIPFCGHIFTGVLVTVCTLVLDFRALLEMGSIATVIQFTASAIILLFIRYQPLPVGICKEYSDLDLYSTATAPVDDRENRLFHAAAAAASLADDDAVASEFLDKRSKLVIVANGTCQIHQPHHQNHHPHNHHPHNHHPHHHQHHHHHQSDHHNDESLFRDVSEPTPPVPGDPYTEKRFTVPPSAKVIVNPTAALISSSTTPLLASSKTSTPVAAAAAASNTNPVASPQTPSPAVRPTTFVNRFKSDRRQQNNYNNNNISEIKVVKKPMYAEANGHSRLLNYASINKKHSGAATAGDMMDAHQLLAASGGGGGKLDEIRSSGGVTGGVGIGGQYGSGFSRNEYGSFRSLASSISSSIVALSTGAAAQADEQTWKHTRLFLLTYVTSSTCMTAVFWMWPGSIREAWVAVTLLCLSLVLMLASGVCIARQPQNTAPLFFRTPYAPLVPLLAITGNMAMLASLPFLSWFRFAVWLIPGLVIYTCYSQRHSLHQSHDDQEVVLFDISQMSTASQGP